MLSVKAKNPKIKANIHNLEQLIKTPKKTVIARSKKQSDYIKALTQNDITMALGPAGTGKSFLAVSVEHELADNFENQKQFIQFKEKCLKLQLRGIEDNEKISFFTKLNAINPVTKEKIPVFFTNYVLMGFGTGAVFGCPAHDKRDFEFAKKNSLKTFYYS